MFNPEYRVSETQDGKLDEFVIKDVLHLERMSNDHFWMQIGDCAIWIHENEIILEKAIYDDSKLKITFEENEDE